MNLAYDMSMCVSLLDFFIAFLNFYMRRQTLGKICKGRKVLSELCCVIFSDASLDLLFYVERSRKEVRTSQREKVV